MKKYVEYHYHDEFMEESKSDIRPVDAFDVYALDIPANVVSFTFIEAPNLKQVAKAPAEKTKLYFLAEPDEVFTTQEIRNHGPEHTLAIDELDRVFNEKKAPDAKSETTLENMDEMLDDFLGPSSPGQIMMDFMADSMEKANCHRVMGNPPLHCRGIHDSATILDKNTREVLFPPYTMK
ncbi:MAG: hypothetical protein JWM96_1286 [Alphaproteobacteria bacterium]|nr:hypothetical protein [Alphaproteobacteria bacterium]